MQITILISLSTAGDSLQNDRIFLFQFSPKFSPNGQFSPNSLQNAGKTAFLGMGSNCLYLQEI